MVLSLWVVVMLIVTIYFMDISRTFLPMAFPFPMNFIFLFLSVWDLLHPEMSGGGQGDVATGMKLPSKQEQLLADVLSQRPAGQYVLVVPFTASPKYGGWVARVCALLQAYYPRDMGARALADILLGVVGPSGKLANIWPAVRQASVLHGPLSGEQHNIPLPAGAHNCLSLWLWAQLYNLWLFQFDGLHPAAGILHAPYTWRHCYQHGHLGGCRGGGGLYLAATGAVRRPRSLSWLSLIKCCCHLTARTD